MAVVEISKAGLETITYELLITVAHCADQTVNSIIATQFLTPLNVRACTPEIILTSDGSLSFLPCPPGHVGVTLQGDAISFACIHCLSLIFLHSLLILLFYLF
jgi:hypothetical protein